MKVRQITLLGHKDHGKSTLIGNLLMLTKSVTQTRINEAKKYSKKLNKDFEPAFILDSFHEEREGGLTIDTTRAEVLYKNTAFSFIDVPGHEELINNMISGASYASVALLIVSAKKDEGIQDQTKRHLFIARMLGIKKLIVAINKMDLVEFSEQRFMQIKDELSDFINRIGFRSEDVSYIPISAYKGENILDHSTNMKWYKGPPLLKALKETPETGRAKDDGALRIILQGFLNGKRNSVMGKVVRGSIKLGEKATCIIPLNVNVIIKSIVVRGKRVNSAKEGNSVVLGLDREINQDVRGSIICGEAYCPIPTDNIRARVFLTKALGNDTTIKFNGMEIRCSIKPLSYIDPTTGQSSERNRLKGSSLIAIDAQLKLSRKIAAERFEDTQELGRFLVYTGTKFAGIGIII
jgi:sulfate adenylyltransferase subunit 1